MKGQKRRKRKEYYLVGAVGEGVYSISRVFGCDCIPGGSKWTNHQTGEWNDE